MSLITKNIPSDVVACFQAHFSNVLQATFIVAILETSYQPRYPTQKTLTLYSKRHWDTNRPPSKMSLEPTASAIHLNLPPTTSSQSYVQPSSSHHVLTPCQPTSDLDQHPSFGHCFHSHTPHPSSRRCSCSTSYWRVDGCTIAKCPGN